jgi:hypothetical protein
LINQTLFIQPHRVGIIKNYLDVLFAISITAVKLSEIPFDRNRITYPQIGPIITPIIGSPEKGLSKDISSI